MLNTKQSRTNNRHPPIYRWCFSPALRRADKDNASSSQRCRRTRQCRRAQHVQQALEASEALYSSLQSLGLAELLVEEMSSHGTGGGAEPRFPFTPKSLLSACRNRKRPFFLGLGCGRAGGGTGDSATGVAGTGDCLPLTTTGLEDLLGGVRARRRFSCRVCRQARLRAGKGSVSPPLRCAHDRPGRVRGGALLVR